MERVGGGYAFGYSFDPLGNKAYFGSNISEKVGYDAYGRLYTGNPNSTSYNGQPDLSDPIGFAGQFGAYTEATYTDKTPHQSGLVWMTHRGYNPRTGRFLSRDPIGYEGGINLYTYASNNPVTHADPSGLDTLDDISNFAAGWGDALTFGATARVRQGLGADEAVNRDSGSYKVGYVVGVVHQDLLLRGAGKAIAASRAAPLGARLLGEIKGINALLVRNLPKVKPLAGYFDVVIHGTGDGFQILKNGKWVSVSHRSLAGFLKSCGYKGGPIRLLSCNAAAGKAAQNLANKLGTEVLAPDNILWVHGNGALTIGKTAVRNTGKWLKLVPGTRP